MLSDQRLEAMLVKAAPIALYKPTFEFKGPFINNGHRGFALAPLDGVKIVHQIRGSLRRDDAAKIYELAYFAKGDTLDIGTNWGLSAFVAASALTDAGSKHRVTTIDLEPKMGQRAKARIAELGLTNVDVVTGDATKWTAAQKRRYGFAFVDHSHAYEHVLGVCENLGKILMPGAYVAFHDFIDRRNADPAATDFRVVQAVRDGLDDRFVFDSTSGCMGIFRFGG